MCTASAKCIITLLFFFEKKTLSLTTLSNDFLCNTFNECKVSERREKSVLFSATI